MKHLMRLKSRVQRVLLALLAILLLPAFARAEIKVSGTVVDENDDPMVGVTVQDIDTHAATSTDIDGNFYISVPSRTSVLKFTFIGYEPQEVKVGKKINFDIHMAPKLSELEEVVVVGYGKQARVSVVGSITSIEPGELSKGNTPNVADNLAGQLAGVIAYKPSGEPGYDQSQFWIRGISSFAGTTSPLVLIDGVERSLSDIDASEIESFSILKDASASAVYGVRGANGVILVNTKRGQIGAPKVSFRYEQAFDWLTNRPNFIGAGDYMSFINQIASESGQKPFSDLQIARTYSGYDPDLYPDVNWIDAVMNDHSTSSHATLNVSGGSDFIRYSFTAAWWHENGILNHDDRLPYDTSLKMNKYNVRANVDMNVTKTTVMRFNVGGYIQKIRKPDNDTYSIFNNAFVRAPYVHPAIYSDGVIPTVPNGINPWEYATQRGYQSKTWTKLEALVGVEQDLKMLTPGLKANVLFSFDSQNRMMMSRPRKATVFNPSVSRDEAGNLIHGEPQNNDGSDYLGIFNGCDDIGDNRLYFQAAVNYDQIFKEKHRVGAMFMYNLTNYDNYSAQPYRHQGIAGRFSYTFDSRYVAEFNFGYNGSENFAKGKRYGFFPSGALGWVVSNEKFWEPLATTVDKLKIRGSIGKVGNDQIGGSRRFAYVTTLNTGAGGYSYGPTNNYSPGSGITEGEIGVSNLTWETVTKYNLGLEFGLFSMFDLQADIFKEKRSNIFMQRSIIPTQAGFSSNPWANYGKVDNKGVEVSLDFHKNFGKDWMVSLRANFTYAKNKVVEYDEPESLKGTYRSLTGRSVGTLWGYLADGLYTDDDFDARGNLRKDMPVSQLSSNAVRPGDIKYVDRNGDGVINAQDEGYIGGVSVPRIVYGFGGNITFKNIDFSFFFQGTGDSHRVLNVGTGSYLMPGSGQSSLGNIYSNYTDRWTEDNPSQDVFWPRLTYGINSHNQQASTWFKKDMSFLRLKSIELGYIFPRKWTTKFGCQQARIYVSGSDLFCISKFKLWDPELDTTNGMLYPLTRSAMVGLELHF